jgi:sugar phosphate isomerase/epimerase
MGVLDADCTTVGEAMSRLGTPAFAERVKAAAEAKYTTAQIRALCHKFEVLDDAALLAAIKEEYGLSP